MNKQKLVYTYLLSAYRHGFFSLDIILFLMKHPPQQGGSTSRSDTTVMAKQTKESLSIRH